MGAIFPLPDWPVIIDPHASRAAVIRQPFRDKGPITKKTAPEGAAVQQGGRFVIDDLDAERFA
ncbi:hypothetical protein [Paracoccus fontiphilus]|uniref:Uncharacterized protein n=1 Tax=Paracoccus fontiphilus TaxID=1815556 RepID=A0ABV7IFF9_9RHOB|nr:hypothetical protein [Paracoccus fontiphilus]